MNDLGIETATEPVVLGVHRVGWLRFRIHDVQLSAAELGVYRLTSTDSFGKLHQI